MSEEVNASPPQVSIERSDMVFAERSQRLDHWLGEVRFLSRQPNYRMYVSVLRDNDPAPTEEARRTCWVNNLKFITINGEVIAIKGATV